MLQLDLEDVHHVGWDSHIQKSVWSSFWGCSYY